MDTITPLTALPEPFYSDESGVVYNIDCREIIHLLEYEVLLCDPPYGMGYQGRSDVIDGGYRTDKLHGDDKPYDVATLEACIKKAKRSSYAFCRWDNLKEMPVPRSFIVWVKNNWTMGCLEREHGRMWEGICFYDGPEHLWAKGRPVDVIEAKRIPAGKMMHPTQKPEALIAKLLEDVVGDVVFDPYLGSGTTAVVAKELGKRYIGCEIRKDFCEIAADRLRQAKLPFFAPAVKPAEQMALV